MNTHAPMNFTTKDIEQWYAQVFAEDQAGKVLCWHDDNPFPDRGSAVVRARELREHVAALGMNIVDCSIHCPM